VPDRDGDLKADEIRYQWWPTGGNFTVPGTGGTSGSGSSGGSGGLLGTILGLLGGSTSGSGGSGSGGSSGTVVTVPPFAVTREFNKGIPSLMTRDARQFNLNYLERTMRVPTSTERLLWSHDPSIAVATDETVDTARYVGVTFQPFRLLPAGTTSFSITRVRLLLRVDGAHDGLLRVSLRTVSTGNVLAPNAPTSININNEIALVSEVSLNSGYQWVDVPFSTLNNLSVTSTTKYAIVIWGWSGTGGPFARVSHTPAQSGLNGTWLVTSSNSGGNWAATTLGSLQYQVWGRTSP
jgi:hypothetical protein